MENCDDIDTSPLLDIFDFNREGFRHIAERICLYLDYHSLVYLKQSCTTIHQFLHSCHLESLLLRRKLLKDWSVGEPRVSHLSFSPNTAVNNVKLVDNHNNVVECLLSTAKNICSYEVGGEKIQDTIDVEETHDNEEVSNTVKDGLKLNLRLPSTSLNSKINSAFLQNGEEGRYKKLFSNNNENIERSQITEFDILKNYLIAGNNNGMLSIWDLETSQLLNSKQLFGIITGLFLDFILSGKDVNSNDLCRCKMSE